MKEILKKLNACNEAIEWVQERTIEQAINECPRGDWMLWLFKRLYPEDLQLLTLTKGHCANTVRYLMDDERSIKAVDAAILFGEGKITKEELNYASASASAAYVAASSASYAAYAYVAASSAADAASAYAAYASSSAAAYAAYAAYAASAYAASAYAAYADADAAADAYDDADDAKKANRLQTANICRKYLGDKLIEGLKYINNEQ